MLDKLCITGIFLGGLVLWAPQAGAQDANNTSQQPFPPIATGAVGGAAPAPKPAASGSPITEDEIVVPDSHPLAGAQNLTLGSTLSGHSFLLPSLGVTTQVQTNPYSSSQAGSSGAINSTYLTGRLALDHTSGRTGLFLDYLAGGIFSSDVNQASSVIQSLNFSVGHQWGRWSVMLGDHLSYTPQSPFGFGGVGGLNNLGVSLGNGAGSSPSFRPGFLPDQSILITGASQISNAVIAQADYALTHRSSLTFVGSYGILDFGGSGFQNSSSAIFQGGYNYLLSRKNSIAIFYRFNNLMFSNASQGIQDHSVQASYGRRITGRLSFQVGAGPDVQLYRAPLAGPSTNVSWVLSCALNYQYRHLRAAFSYDHSLTGGSGLLAGSTTGVLSESLTHSFNRDWDGTVSVGYSRNQAIQQTTLNASKVSPQAWFATARLSRHFVRYGSLFIAYSASGQSDLGSVCSVPACRLNSLSSTVSIGYNWGLRPIVLE